MNSPENPRKGRRFLTTHWTLVRDAGDPDSSGYREAREALCESYWFPLYAFLRRYGCAPDEAQDMTQGFLARMLDKDDFRLADETRGKFRSFLLASLKHFVANERKQAKRLKRGGGAIVVPIDSENAESAYAQEPVDNLTPDKIFERTWALSVLNQALDRLEEDWLNSGKSEQFDLLKAYLTPGKESTTYRDVGEALEMSEGAVKVAVHRLRKAYRTELRRVIADTVSSETEIEDEIRDLFGAFSND